MDIGGTKWVKRISLQLPLGFGMALAMNEPAMQGYVGLTESEKEASRFCAARTSVPRRKSINRGVPCAVREHRRIAAEESGEKFV